jgi:putative transposase
VPAATSANRRNSARLREFDYTSSGAYFVTICAHEREPIFGHVLEGEMQRNQVGEIILDEWERMGSLRAEVALDKFIVMPDHVHAIVWIERSTVGARLVGARLASPLLPDGERLRTAQREIALSKNRQSSRPIISGVAPKSLGAIVGGFKSAVTKCVNESRGTSGIPVWQRNYHDRIIRNDRELNAIREYITANPANWSRDLEASTDLELHEFACQRVLA